MDATCKVQDNIHVFRLVHNMCPGFWVHIKDLKRLEKYKIRLMELRETLETGK